MHINIYLLLLWSVCLLAPVQLFAERYAYPLNDSRSFGSRSNSGVYGQYQWRPLNQHQEMASQTEREWKRSADQSTQPYRDYTDTPFGLPEGTYRPVPQRHEITPYHQGYRFRPLNPSEQERIKQRNLTNRETRQPVGELRFRPQQSTSETGRFGYSQGNQYRFRPDERLDRGFPSDTTPFYTSEPQLMAP
ncbi:MAG: hypothetical protein JAY99_05070 [Candidatus Thiodiazotropha lotti]|uniref:hypothetical protein n=1 Tax=Candidatus Thiodiazotropha endoloripes TaxID=1818881 RepID=UPI00083E2977|nr:hypothetical protein [Candidatus Thiodiazotropha endoloripes]MCG7899001.1 hypothetical protein [Candidatus Thiodiazotropha weberae]MCG7992811.1 hypothetical protein [Candidatus Thiodiazotropha lotti]MCG7901740.1 hypothetical protein [Candidatus Thiodiazotropha weberae]MCG7912391.1 hypothetical protein [Candidatus Thiodiazotropha weberae]MCG7998876.1 hypothetical protein [Candidatus Thiodiazotropha lotti]